MEMNKVCLLVVIIATLILIGEVCRRVAKKEKCDTELSSFLIAFLTLVISIATLYTTVNIKEHIDKYDTVDSYIIGWSNSGTPRESYTIEQINEGCLGDRIVFNSISDSNVGHEFNFVAARENAGENEGAKNVWNGNVIEAQKGESYLVRLYCHNNSPLGYDAVAEDVQIRFEIHDTVFVNENDTGLFEYNDGYYCVAVHGHIYSSNASPDLYSDGVKFVSNKPFHLEYIPGSAFLENNGIGTDGGIALADNIISEGVMIGYDNLDGRIPGCYQFSSYSVIVVVPVFD